MAQARKSAAAPNTGRMPPKPKRTSTSRGKNAERRSPPKPAAPATPVPTPPEPAVVPSPASKGPKLRGSRWTVGNAVAVVVGALAVTIAVLGIVRSRGGDESLKLELGVPTAASASELEGYATGSRPVYWVGPPSSGRLEVTRTSRPATYVRYLPAGVALGDRTARFTAIATYPFAHAYASMQRSARSRGFLQKRISGGGLAVWSAKPGTSVYVAYPGRGYLVEVYDPSPAKARSLAFKELSRVP